MVDKVRRAEHYPDTDSLYNELSGEPGSETREVSEGVNVDLDARGNARWFRHRPSLPHRGPLIPRSPGTAASFLPHRVTPPYPCCANLPPPGVSFVIRPPHNPPTVADPPPAPPRPLQKLRHRRRILRQPRPRDQVRFARSGDLPSSPPPPPPPPPPDCPLPPTALVRHLSRAWLISAQRGSISQLPSQRHHQRVPLPARPIALHLILDVVDVDQTGSPPRRVRGEAVVVETPKQQFHDSRVRDQHGAGDARWRGRPRSC